MSDRTVHAYGGSGQVVRYDRAGKWYWEPIGGQRQRLNIAQAVRRAMYLWHEDSGSVNYGSTISFVWPHGDGSTHDLQ